MQVVHDIDEARALCDEARAEGKRVGVVPTMGALHEGHLALVDETARRGATCRVVTIFVNPLQFGPSEDLERYPRTLANDVALCQARGADLVFAPSAESMYPPGFQTHVEVEQVTSPLEGSFRPGHFRGVATVVAKLFHIVGPSVAIFGRKDYQQWRVLSRMVDDLAFPIEVVGHPIVREPDGLALSSRNRYLSVEQRQRALGIVTGLRAACRLWERGVHEPDVLTEACGAPILESFDRIDYVALADPDRLGPWDGVGPAVLLVAAHLGATRLIDNVVLGEETIP